VLFAGVMMLLVGGFHAVLGLTAVINDSFYTVSNGYSLEVDVSTWGWLQILGGIIVAFAGALLMSGFLLARIVAVFVVMVSAVSSFSSIPYYPVWNIVIFTIDVAIIWAIVAHGHELAIEE
jgi:hypothetical protein